MSLSDALSKQAKRAELQIPHIQTEEDTVIVLVNPLVTALGYDILDLTEVKPQYIADFGEKKGMKVDIAILQDHDPIILIECKKVGNSLDYSVAQQLAAYLANTPARIGILTDGIVYKFFGDLDAPNKMDQRPFYEFNLLGEVEQSIAVLSKFTKQAFNIEEIRDDAYNLKYTRGLKQILNRQLHEPDQEFTKLLFKQVHGGLFNKKAREQFAPLVREAFRAVIKDHVSFTLREALDRTTEEADDTTIDESRQHEQSVVQEPEIVTTAQEIEGCLIVKAILHPVLDVSRVSIDDFKNVCNIILDEKSQSQICKMWFNESKLQLGVFDEEGNATKHPIDSLNGMYTFAEEIKARAQRLANK